MTNQEFELECKQLVEGRNYKSSRFIGKILNKEGKELEKQQASIAILAYILPELLTHGCIIRTTTNEIAEACNCKSTMVNNVLGFAGFKYERDKVTHKAGYESKGLFERYYQFEYVDDQCTKMKRTSSVFNIVATQALFDLLRDELGLDITINKAELDKLHEDSKAKAYTKKVTRETKIITITKDTVIFNNTKGTTTSVKYDGIESAINELQSLKESVEYISEPEQTETHEVVEENVQEVNDTLEDEELSFDMFADEDVIDESLNDMPMIEKEVKKIVRERNNNFQGFSTVINEEDEDDTDEFIPTFNVNKSVSNEDKILVEGKGMLSTEEYQQFMKERNERKTKLATRRNTGFGKKRQQVKIEVPEVEVDFDDDIETVATNSAFNSKASHIARNRKH